MLILYWMFNGIISESDRRPNWDTFLNRWDSEIEECSIERLTLDTLWGVRWSWAASECAQCFEKYQKARYKPAATHLPRLLEVVMMAKVANQFLSEGSIEGFRNWVNRSIFDASGKKNCQDYLAERYTQPSEFDPLYLLMDDKVASDHQVRENAYFRWEKAERPAAEPLSFWLEAEQELRPPARTRTPGH